mmetsp:Transcript_6036/g.10171  ORF Transcript_6036/g.10171 Transcript_6036/m.10171 type:complete len:498 (-) Transcript_6036:110-1603(-)
MAPITRSKSAKEATVAGNCPVTRSVSALRKKHKSIDVKTVNKIVAKARRISNRKQHHNNKKAAAKKAQHYTSKAEQRAGERALNIKQGVLASFKQFALDVINAAKTTARDNLASYLRSSVLVNGKLSFRVHSTEETTVLVEELKLHEMLGDRQMIAATITVPDNERIGLENGERVMKLTISQKDEDVKTTLNKRNPRRIDGLKDADIVIIEDERGEVMAIILKEIIPLELTKQFNFFHDFYAGEKTLYTRGCRAATYPDAHDILRCLKSKDARDCGGFKQSNVKQIIGLKVTQTGRNVMIHYKNKKGKQIKWAFTSNLDRKAFPRSDFFESPFNPLIEFLESIFDNISQFWLKKHGCDESKIDGVMKKVMSKLKVTGGLIRQHINKLGIHTDPSNKLPTLICGPTVYLWNDDTKDWTQRVCDGGRLVMVDGAIYLEYLPQDVIILNGNILHTITELTQKKRGKHVKGGYTRFSVQLYSGYNRGNNKHGRYGSFSCQW